MTINSWGSLYTNTWFLFHPLLSVSMNEKKNPRMMRLVLPSVRNLYTGRQEKSEVRTNLYSILLFLIYFLIILIVLYNWAILNTHTPTSTLQKIPGIDNRMGVVIGGQVDFAGDVDPRVMLARRRRRCNLLYFSLFYHILLRGDWVVSLFFYIRSKKRRRLKLNTE